VFALRYSDLLRAIGQDLEMRGIKTFDIRCEGEEILVDCGYQAPPAATPVTLSYTFEDIKEIQVKGEEKRGQSSSEARDFFTLSQTLRALGGHVDQKKARLLRLSNSGSTGADVLVRIEYRTPQGERVIDEHSGSAIYDICVNMYKRRGKAPGNFDKYGRRRR
jgi:hypothetical protein